MANKLFGVADPYYDALRVQSNQAIWPDAGGGSGSTGGVGLENKIYLWPADGSTITTFDPDQAGLIAALAAATSGDTVWLPSIAIALTAAITIPAGVALIGISHEAQLNSSGFNGTAIILSADSICCNFTATMTSNGTTATLFDATASGSRLDRIRGTVSGGSAANTGSTTGSIESAIETWFATATNIFYSSDYFSNTVPLWNKVASIPAITLEYFVITHDGSMVYVKGVAAGIRSIWKCANPKAASPTWINIATTGDTIGGFVMTIEADQLLLNGTTLITMFNRTADGYEFYAEYNGAWSITQIGHDYGYQVVYQYELTIHSPSLDVFQLYTASPFALVHQWISASSGGFSLAWRNHIGGNIYIVTTSATSGNDIRNATANSVCLNIPGSSGAANLYTVTGALNGVQVYVVGYAGTLYLSDDGATFAAVGSAWGRGWVFDSFLSGGGTLVWVQTSIPNSTVPTRLYNRDGSVLRDMTGNFWSLTTGDQAVVGAGVVYP